MISIMYIGSLTKTGYTKTSPVPRPPSPKGKSYSPVDLVDFLGPEPFSLVKCALANQIVL